MKRFPRLAMLLSTALLCQCAHLSRTYEDYAIVEEEPTVNGARVTAELVTTEGSVSYSLSAMVYLAAGEKETGPYRLLLSAWGDPEVHQTMTVESLRVRTATRNLTLPKSRPIRFEPGSDPSQGVQATYLLPGLLDIDYKKDGDVYLEASVRVRSDRRTQSAPVTLRLRPTPKKERRFATILDDLGEPNDPSQPWKE